MGNMYIFDNEGIKVLGEYKSYKDKLHIKCKNGHITAITLNAATMRVKRGVLICKECARYISKDLLKDKTAKLLESKGYSLLSEEVDYLSKVKYRCDKGHTNAMAISNLLNGKSCPDCSGNSLVTTQAIRDTLVGEGYTLLGTPTGSKTKFECECPNKHIFTTSYNSFKHSTNRCPQCVDNKTSKQEEEVYGYVSSIYDGVIIRNDRKILEGKELDIVLVDKKIAIEYCGLYWHSELQGKDRNYHLNKLNMCNDKGYKLITIFEDEWLLQNNKCKSRLASYVNSTGMRRIFARKCTIEAIAPKVAREFCVANHIQNYGSGATIKLGAFYDGELVACMTFSKPSLAKGRKKSNGVEYELHRFCPKLHTVVIGAAGKLMKHFERNYECDRVFTFADKRWSSAQLYYNLGFEKVSDSAPCYFYFKGTVVRQHRFLYRKNVLKDKLGTFDPELTEVQNMQANGFDRIFDCGNFKLCKEYENA